MLASFVLEDKKGQNCLGTSRFELNCYAELSSSLTNLRSCPQTDKAEGTVYSPFQRKQV